MEGFFHILDFVISIRLDVDMVTTIIQAEETLGKCHLSIIISYHSTSFILVQLISPHIVRY